MVMRVAEDVPVGLLSIRDYRDLTLNQAPDLRIQMALQLAHHLIGRYHGPPYVDENTLYRATWRTQQPERLLQFGRKVQRIDRVEENGRLRDPQHYGLLYGTTMDLRGFAYQGWAGGIYDAYIYDGFGWPTLYGVFNEVEADFLPEDDRIVRMQMQMDLTTLHLQYTGLQNYAVAGQSISPLETEPTVAEIMKRLYQPDIIGNLPVSVTGPVSSDM